MNSERVTLRIADLAISVTGDKDQLKTLNSERYMSFHCIDEDPDLCLNLRTSTLNSTELLPKPEDMLFDSGTVWSLFDSGEKVSILLRSPVEGRLPYRLATFDRHLTSGEIITVAGSEGAASERGYDPLEFPLSEILTVCLLARNRGLMVHASGIISNGIGYLFPGNSTDGKSTIAQIWKESGSTVLNDDRIILLYSESGFRMYGTPWHGDLSDVSAEGTTLRSVNFLSHGEVNRIESVTGAEAVSMLLKRSFLPLWSPEGMGFTLDFVSRHSFRTAGWLSSSDATIKPGFG